MTNDGGATWTRSIPPAGVTTLSTVSCPSATTCYAGGGQGIIKSSDGGSTWSVQDSTFPAESISCFTIDECTAVGGHQDFENHRWNELELPRRSLRHRRSIKRVMFVRDHMRSRRSSERTIHPLSKLRTAALGRSILSTTVGLLS